MAIWNRNTRRGRSQSIRVVRASARKRKIGSRADAAEQIRREPWQEESHANFNELGIIKAPTWWSGNAISKLKLFAGVRPIDDPEGSPIPVTDPESGIPSNLAAAATAEIERLKSASGGRAEILRMIQMNLELTGMTWLIGTGPRTQTKDDPFLPGAQYEELTPEQWDVRSVLEVDEKTDGSIIVHKRPGDHGTTLDQTLDEAICIFQRNPGWSSMADCHMRGVLTETASLVLLLNEVQAESKSRQSNGILILPNGMGIGPPTETDSESGDEATTDEFMDTLADAFIEPIEDPSAAASVVPTFLRGPLEEIKEVRHLSLARDTTAVLESRIEARKVGIAEGLNLPPEVVRGHMGTTYANAAQIDQDTYDDYMVPRVGLICDGLTTAYLQPHLLDQGFPAELVERVIVAPDPSDMIKSADPAEFVDAGVTLNTISDEAWRRYRGFSEDDAPEPLEQLIRAILHQRTWDPGLTETVVKALDPSLNIPAPPGEAKATGSAASAPMPAEPMPMAASAQIVEALGLVLAAAEKNKATKLAARATGALAKRAPGHALAAIDRDLRTKTLIAANAAMTRALERAGNRLKAKVKNREVLKTINPLYAAQQLGPHLVASAGFSDEDLIGDDAFDGTVAQFDQWCAHAQEKALAIAGGLVTLTGSQREHLRSQQTDARKQAGVWMRDALLALAVHRLYDPDELPTHGEFDPSMKVPAGLVREAMAIAGGAQGFEQKQGTFVTEVNGQPPGGIGTGATITDALTGGGAKIEGYIWDYGPGLRLHPFEPHEDLDGEFFENFSGGDDRLATDAGTDWVGVTGDSLWPGDHDGCLCGVIPVFTTTDAADG